MTIDTKEQALMLKWAEKTCKRRRKAAIIAQNAFRTADRDLESIRAGKPTKACLARYQDSKLRLEKLRITR